MPLQIDFSGLAKLMEIVNQGNVQAIQAQNAPRFTRDQSGFGQRGAGGLAGWYKNNPDFRPGENDAVGYQRIQDRTALEQQGARNAQAQAYNEFLRLKGQEFDMRRAEAGKRGQAWTPGGLVPNAANVPGGVVSSQPAVNTQGATPQQQTQFNPGAAAGNLIANMTGIAPNAIQQGMQQIGQPKQSAAQPPQMPVKSPMPTQSPFGQASQPQSGGLNYRQQIEATRFGPPAQSQARPTYFDTLRAQLNPGAQLGVDVWPFDAMQFTMPQPSGPYEAPDMRKGVEWRAPFKSPWMDVDPTLQPVGGQPDMNQSQMAALFEMFGPVAGDMRTDSNYGLVNLPVAAMQNPSIMRYGNLPIAQAEQVYRAIAALLGH